MVHPDISVVVPWCNRPNLGKMLRGNADALERCDAEVLVVNFGGDSTRLAALLDECEPDWNRLRIIHVDVRAFNKCCAQNLGVHASRADIILLIDEDIVLEDSSLFQAREAVARGDCFATLERVDESEPAELSSPFLESVAGVVAFRTRDGRTIEVETNRRYLGSGARAGPGVLCVMRQHFLDVGGMNSKLHGRGWGDLDLIARLQLALALERRAVGRGTHFSHSTHDPWEYDDRTREESEPVNYARCLQNYAHARLRGTYTADVQRWAPLAKTVAPSERERSR